MNVRHIPWNRVIWRDTGYGDDFQVTMWIVPHGYPFFALAFEYDAPTPHHIIRNCRRRHT